MCQRFGYDRIISLISGTDAVDAACKIARKYGIAVRGIDPAEVLILGVKGCYHGLSTSMWSLQDPGPKRAGEFVMFGLMSFLFFFPFFLFLRKTKRKEKHDLSLTFHRLCFTRE